MRTLAILERARAGAAKVEPAVASVRARAKRDVRRIRELALAVTLWDEGWVLDRYAYLALGCGPRPFYAWRARRKIKYRTGGGGAGRRWAAVPLRDLDTELQRRHHAGGNPGKHGMITALHEQLVRDLEERLGDLGLG